MTQAKNSAESLGKRISEMRRRHFGPRGKGEFARRLDVTTEEYEHYERSRLPSGDLMVRMCELTGEDLQWLLTGVPSRGTVVISGARGRHQDLLARIARELDDDPTIARSLEAFFDLRTGGPEDHKDQTRRLMRPAAGDLIPILAVDDLPEILSVDDPETLNHALALPPPETIQETQAAALIEPGAEDDVGGSRPLSLLSGKDADGRKRRYVRSRELVQCFPRAFGVTAADDDMRPMIRRGDALIVAVGSDPVPGRPAVCRFRVEPKVRCRIWLGQDERHVHLGRVCDGEHEDAPVADHCWSLEVLYRIATPN